jgi:hypothetical protein
MNVSGIRCGPRCLVASLQSHDCQPSLKTTTNAHAGHRVLPERYRQELPDVGSWFMMLEMLGLKMKEVQERRAEGDRRVQRVWVGG